MEGTQGDYKVGWASLRPCPCPGYLGLVLVCIIEDLCVFRVRHEPSTQFIQGSLIGAQYISVMVPTMLGKSMEKSDYWLLSDPRTCCIL